MKNLFVEFKNILILSPHTDDMELGCGGTIAKFISEGKNIYQLVFSICEESVPKEFSSNILEKECRKSAKVLGIKKDHLIIEKYKVRKFPEFRQEILEKIISIRKSIQFDLIILPSTSDIHQDHKIICEEGLRAFKNYNILGYQLPWNNLITNSNCFIEISQTHLEKKIEAISKYESQGFRRYTDREMISAQAKFIGTQSGRYNLAESFELIRFYS